jgi:hypothetical protein
MPPAGISKHHPTPCVNIGKQLAVHDVSQSESADAGLQPTKDTLDILSETRYISLYGDRGRVFLLYFVRASERYEKMKINPQ